uniref:NADH-ubiquinone oxidoreductase chain 6 n=1 Tax=Laomedia healyi TaxID=576627 RepID=A0A4Y5QJG1_9EUCA|nr:NADH dehydrogenase subunit 6 [Laomedia healyi]QCX31760.1 NADH dehydrogenase subunit 6 [Laomedia healyi]
MLTMTTPLLIFLTILFTRLNHPLSMGLLLLTQTVLVCVSTGITNPSFWFSYILFLVFLGGMLVLFIYVASLASNKPFKVSTLPLILLLLALILTPLSSLITDPMLITSNPHMPSFSMNLSTSLHHISPVYQPPSTPFTIFIILYLLLTLFAVVKITNSFFGPLRLSK